MDDTQVILILTKRNLELERDLQELTIEYEDAVRAREDFKGWIADVQEALDYDGHPGNIPDVIRERFKALELIRFGGKGV